MSEPMPFAKIRLSLMFAAEHELPIELGTDEVWSVLNKLDQLSAETGKAIARAEAAERDLAASHAAVDKVLDNRNAGMCTGDSSLSYRLTELVSYYADMERELASLKGGGDE